MMAKKILTQAAYDDDNVQGLADQVKGQALAVKQTFDKASVDIKVYNNTGLLVELADETQGASGANTIGNAMTGVAGDNVGDNLVNIKTQLDGLVVGMTPPGSDIRADT